VAPSKHFNFVEWTRAGLYLAHPANPIYFFVQFIRKTSEGGKHARLPTL